jgi:hypothetical protein
MVWNNTKCANKTEDGGNDADNLANVFEAAAASDSSFHNLRQQKNTAQAADPPEAVPPVKKRKGGGRIAGKRAPSNKKQLVRMVLCSIIY